MPEIGSVLGKLFRARSIGPVFLLFGAGICVSLALQIATSRALGPKDFGLFAVIYAGATIASGVGAAGHDMAALRFGAIYSAPGRELRFEAYVRTVMMIAAPVSVFVALVLFILVAATQPVQVEVALAAAVASIFWTGVRLNVSFIRSWGSTASSLLFDRVLREGVPLFIILAILALSLRIGLFTVTAALAVGAGAAWLISFSTIVKRISLQRKPLRFGRQERYWQATAVGLFGVNIAELTFSRAETLVISLFHMPIDVAYLNYIVIIANLFLLPTLALNTIFMPIMAQAFHSRKHNLLRKTVLHFSIGGTLAAVPIAIIIGLWPQIFLKLFGSIQINSDIMIGLKVLTIARLITLPFTPLASLMMMTGLQRHLLFLYIVILPFKAFGIWLGYSVGGLSGACIASGIASIAFTAGMWLIVRSRLGIPVGIA